MSAAKDRHVAVTGTWGAALKRASRRAIRSVLRGIGAPRQSGTFGLTEVARMVVESREVVDD